MKKAIVLFLLGFASVTVNAQDQPNKNAKYSVTVNGNCEQCKKRIEKASYSISGVKSAVWSVDSHQLNVLLDERKSSFNLVEQAVAKVGHDTDNYIATQEDYEKLHTCCMYERSKENKKEL